ncbi:DEAD/DEAH box helicase [Pedobacter nutrimenti]|uniref:SNF2 family DNA or RNA helicase n=1 Tax=Pedobacter nutrimenti TaxID=1241337 RepID=A0A318UCJ0_9SPHI|nr:DEAD/DEAH box helicase [Pedobacter nutrimenti]PYF70637.1 SNF2 family DNA or RNA helicase [Pedobacter nutrimenti]
MPEREVIIENFNASEADGLFMARHAGHLGAEEQFFEVQAIDPELGYGLFTCKRASSGTNYVSVALEMNSLRLGCDCKSPGKKLCIHQAQVLGSILHKRELRIFFDAKFRHEELRKVAKEYGLEEEKQLDDFFTLEYQYKSVEIKPRAKELFKIGPQARASLKEALLPQKSAVPQQAISSAALRKQVLVFRKHKYYSHFYAELYEAESTGKGKIKNPLVLLNPMDLIWKTEDKDELRFYSAVSRFRQSYEEVTDSDLEALKALVKNPGVLEVYELEQGAKNVTVNALEKVQLKALHLDIRLKVDQRGNFYEVTGELYLDDHAYHLEKLQLKYKYFLDYNKTLYLIDNPDFLKMIDFFKKHNNKILIHQSGFDAFQENILSRLEDRVHISYAYLKPATPKQLLENNFDVPREKIIYLSDEGEFVLITPVMKYGNVEVPVLSKKTIYAIDSRGNPFTVSRDQDKELRLTSVLIRQHPHFEEQLEMSNHFYLHRSRFLDNGWFLEAFEDWQKEEIQVLGFNELKNNKLNPNKAKIDIKVLSGLDWFETAVSLSYGQQQVSLKYLHKSIRDKNKFVQLGDGTLGLLPQEWMEKFSAYFKAGELAGECIRTPRSNFGTIEELYEQEVLSKEVRLELSMYKKRLRNFESITEVSIPKGLQGELRAYQRQGLNWLNFLDEFGFGGCLADDMGLGKTIQIIAFMLLQKEKAEKLPASLLVLPTTLIFNWQAELGKFAPGLKILTVYGTERVKDIEPFERYDVVITSYGTLLYDIRFMKKYLFNYVFFDESQTIKNPSSQRYQAAALLKARNRIVITGTPVENNTFDLYGQLSLASPGLLGSRQFFKEHYFVPIDQFKDSKRALELQKKIRPFILRRTKKQVASELPDKTEMVIYCEMGEEQRKVYDSYRKEYRNYLLNQKEEDLSRQGMHVLKGMTLLRQICNSAALLKEDVFYGDASSKIAVLMEEIEGKAAQHKILVFSQFVGMLDLIRKELDQKGLRYEYLTGQTRNRAAKVEAFQNKEEVRVFLISLKAGGTGLNLTEADYVYLVDPWWNPAVENQAIDRSYRIGQKKNVIAVRLICPDTIEEKISRLQESKKDLVNDLIKTDATMLKHFSKQELLDLFN